MLGLSSLLAVSSCLSHDPPGRSQRAIRCLLLASEQRRADAEEFALGRCRLGPERAPADFAERLLLGLAAVCVVQHVGADGILAVRDPQRRGIDFGNLDTRALVQLSSPPCYVSLGPRASPYQLAGASGSFETMDAETPDDFVWLRRDVVSNAAAQARSSDNWRHLEDCGV